MIFFISGIGKVLNHYFCPNRDKVRIDLCYREKKLEYAIECYSAIAKSNKFICYSNAIENYIIAICYRAIEKINYKLL